MVHQIGALLSAGAITWGGLALLRPIADRIAAFLIWSLIVLWCVASLLAALYLTIKLIKFMWFN